MEIHDGSKKAVTFSKAQASHNSSFVILSLLSFPAEARSNYRKHLFMLYFSHEIHPHKHSKNHRGRRTCHSLCSMVEQRTVNPPIQVRFLYSPYFNQQSWCEMSGKLKHTGKLKSIKFLLHYTHLKNLILLCKNWH